VPLFDRGRWRRVSEPREAARNRRLRAVHGSPAEQATIDRGRAEDRRVPKPDRVLAPHTAGPRGWALPNSQKRLDQPTYATLPAWERRRPSPRRDWAGSTFVKMVDLSGVLSNQDLKRRLGGVVEKLAAVRTRGEVRERPSCRQRPRRPGWVVRAVIDVLAGRGEPMRAKDIHAAVEALIGEPVAWSSVKQALASHVSGPSPCFVRIARGRYVLA
jgi:hypothetical protein